MNSRLLVAALAFTASYAMAQPNQDHTCQGGHNCNEGGSGEQTQSQEQHQSAIATVESNNVSTSISGADSDARATASSGGNSLSASTGESRSSSEATGGSNSTTVGVSHSYEDSASSAATIFAGHCQSGASGQISGGGFSVVNSEQFCDYIRMAAIMREAYEWELQSCECQGICTIEIATVEMVCQRSDKADGFLHSYYENLEAANEMLQATEVTATVDRTVGQLIRPIALIALLILL